MQEKFFTELEINKIKNYLIFLDIDGTIIYDSGSFLDEKTIKKIEELKQDNKIYLCSNKNNHSRNQIISDLVKIPYLNIWQRKPSRKILDFVENKENWPLMVIGDKFLTDGLFAKKIGSRFIKVKRIVSSHDNWFVKVSYLIDDALYYFFKKF